MRSTGADPETAAWSAIRATAVDEAATAVDEAATAVDEAAAAMAVAAVGIWCQRPGLTACHAPQQTERVLPTPDDWH